MSNPGRASAAGRDPLQMLRDGRPLLSSPGGGLGLASRDCRGWAGEEVGQEIGKKRTNAGEPALPENSKWSFFLQCPKTGIFILLSGRFCSAHPKTEDWGAK